MREKARQHLRPLLKQYLEAEDIETSAFTTQCPCCGKRALLNADDTWRCFNCEASGDVLDYDMRLNPELNELESAKHIRQLLGLKVLALNTVEGNALMDMEFKPTGFLIEKLIGKGVYILAGASKIGKSWLVLWLADCVLHSCRGLEDRQELAGALAGGLREQGRSGVGSENLALRSLVCESRRYPAAHPTAAQRCDRRRDRAALHCHGIRTPGQRL